MRILAGNWKMFKVRTQAEHFFQEVGIELVQSEIRKIVAASPTLLETCLQFATGTGIEIFSQNCAWADEGAFTGEISPLQLKELGVQGTIIGHSERRQYFGESDATCAKRAEAAIKHELDVIYCIGESLEERKTGKTFQVLEEQLKSFIPVAQKNPARFILAYEPVWAIGTGLTADEAQIREAHGFLAKKLAEANLSIIPILYGGSVKTTNFKQIAAIEHVSGGLVGGASLEPKAYVELHNCL